MGLQELRGGIAMSTAEMFVCAADPTFAPCTPSTSPSSSPQSKRASPWRSVRAAVLNRQQVPSETSRRDTEGTSSQEPTAKVSEVDDLHHETCSTSQLLDSYLNAKSLSMPELKRPPLWDKVGDTTDEDKMADRLRELDGMDDWRRHREFLQRHIRELPESGMKKRLVGDPRLHDRNALHDIQRLKQEDIQRHRDRARKIQDVMGECSKSRYQLMRMQKQIAAPPELPILGAALAHATEDVALA